MKKGILFLLLTLVVLDGYGQCAMCRTTIVNNVSNGELALAEGLNFGIMYLFSAPYLAVIAVASIVVYKMRQHAKKSRPGNI